MNPYFRTGTGVTDENTLRVIFAFDSGKPSTIGIPHNKVEVTYIGSTNNISQVIYKFDGFGVTGYAMEYFGDTSVNNAKLSKITVIPADQIVPDFTNPGFIDGEGPPE
jgi:hypothetical protein